MATSIADSVDRLQGLQRDLQNITATTLPNIERLWSELELRVDEFRALLDKKPKNDASRRSLSSDRVHLGDEDFSISESFQQQSLQIAEALDLDELEAAGILVSAESYAHTIDRTPLATAIILYHQQRQFLFECLRLCLERAYSDDEELPDAAVTSLRRLIILVVQSKSALSKSYWQRCMEAMTTLEMTLQHITDRVQSVALTDQVQSIEFGEVMSFQTSSIMRQHECLGAIIYWLAKGNQTSPDDLKSLIDRVKTIDRYDTVLVHYIPSLFAMLSKYALSEVDCSAEDALALHQKVTSTRDVDSWTLRPFQAAAISVWLAGYSGRNAEAAPFPDMEERAGLLSTALRDGAFQFMLAVGQDVKERNWYDPARQGLTRYLFQDTPALQSEIFIVDHSFRDIVMERLQGFVDSYITYMPDSLRHLKHEEDDQRRQVQNGIQNRPMEHDLHFNRFLMVVAHAFLEYPIASEAFWDDIDGNLYGFVQWASQRQSTPRVAAFCEMLCALSSGEICANAAHKFLLDETPSRSRRTSPLSWQHIFDELDYYAGSIQNRPGTIVGSGSGKNEYADLRVEPESAMMLESYLRLTTHLAKESPEARSWFLTRTTFNLTDHLLSLCASGIDTHLRACAFAALSALLIDSDANTHGHLWHVIDIWIYGQSLNNASGQPRAPHVRSPEDYEKIILSQLSSGFEEPNAFTGLLVSMVTQGTGSKRFDNSLPFPEDLGSRYRMAGIDSYVDFVMDVAFARKSLELLDPVQLHMLHWNSLTFAQSCLFTFNEDLFALASSSKISVDSAIDTSSLAAYARLHPFARTMEWLFNDGVIAALFGAAKQDIQDVNDASEDSPLVLSLMQSISVIDLVLSLQRTYFEIVRPIVKTQSSHRKQPVANAALASFDDAVTNHLDLVPLLGLYVGSGHGNLAIVSLRLLQRLSRSPKLASPAGGLVKRVSEKSRLIAAMEKNSENHTISLWLAGIMTFDAREIESGQDCPGAIIKSHVLQFLATSIATVINRPSLAHLLLGFACTGHTIYLDEDGPFAATTSLFHAITAFVIAAPDGMVENLLTWLLSMKKDALQILRLLWSTPMSSTLTLDALRTQDFLCTLSLQQATIQPNSIIDDTSLNDPHFLLNEAATGYMALLQGRSAFLDYAATELQAAHTADLPTLQQRIRDSLMGSTTLLDGVHYTNPGIFDYLDFLEVDFGGPFPLVNSRFFDVSHFDCCRSSSDADAGMALYEISRMEHVLHLQHDDLQKVGRFSDPADLQQFEADSRNLIQCVVANNQRQRIIHARRQVLVSWTALVSVMIKCCMWNEKQQSAFILQLLQLVLPQLERSYKVDQAAALVLAKFCGFLSGLVQRADPKGNNTTEAPFFDIFKVGLEGIQISDTSSELRAACARLCQTHLTVASKSSTKVRSKTLRYLESTGDQLMDTLCEDAYNGEEDCKMAAMSLLDHMVSLANDQHSPYVLQSFDRSSFVQVVTGALRALPFELRAASSGAVPIVLSFYDSGLSLLLRLSQSRSGAGAVFNASFFSALRDSGVFTADPDIGLDAENPAALSNYYDLMLSVLRIINAIVLSRGTQNDQTIHQARHFLTEYRPTIVQIYKRSARIGSASETEAAVLNDLVDQLTILIGASSFLESQGEQLITPEPPRLFA